MANYKNLEDIMNVIDFLNIPNGNTRVENTKEWAKYKISFAIDSISPVEPEYQEFVKEWNDWIDEMGGIEKIEPWDINENLTGIFDFESYGYLYKNLKLTIMYYRVHDFMGVERLIPALVLVGDDCGEPVEMVISVSFGEFIGQSLTTYIDTNNYPGIEKFLVDNHIGFFAGFTKKSGYCEYPLYVINPRFLKDSDDFEKYYELLIEGLNVVPESFPTIDEFAKMFYESANARIENGTLYRR